MLAALAGFGGRAQATIAVGKTGSSSGSGTSTVSLTNVAWSGTSTASMANPTLLVAVLSGNAASSDVTFTASGWTLATSSSQPTSGTPNIKTSIYYIANNTAAPTTSSFSAVGTGTISFAVKLAEYSGIVASSPLDTAVTGTGAAAATDTVSVTAGSTTFGPELVLGAFAEDNKWNWGTPTGFTAFGQVTQGNSQSLSVVYKTNVGSGSLQSMTDSIQSGKSGNLAGAIVAFQGTSTTYYWVGGVATGCTSGTLLASNGSCWATSSGGSTTGTAPSASDSAVFDGVGGRTGNCSWDIANVGGVTVQAGYTGTITQAGQNTTFNGTLTLSGGTYNGHATNTVATTSNIVVSGGIFTGHGAAVGVVGLTVSNGTFTAGTSAVTASGVVTLSGGTVGFGSAPSAFQGGLTASGAAVTLTTGTTTVTGAATVSGGSVSLPGTFSTTGLFTQSGGSITTTSAATMTFGTGIAALASAFTMTGGTFTHSAGTLNTTNGTTTDISGTATFNGTGGTQNIKGQLNVSGGTMTLGTAAMNSTRSGGGNPGNAGVDHLVNVSGGTLAFASTFTFPQTSSAMTIGGTINAGSGTISFATQNTVTISGAYNANGSTTSFGASDPVTLSGIYSAGSGSTTFNAAVTLSGTYNANTSSTSRFASTTALSGTFNANSSTGTTFAGVVTMSTGSAFNGNTGATTFSVAPTLTAGTFTVADAGSTGSVTFSATTAVSFGASMALVFPATGGDLRLAPTGSLSVAGSATASGGTATPKPKIECNGCTATQGVAMTFSGTVNIDGLEFDNATTAGVTFASTATLTTLKHLTFKNNAGNSASGTHLTLTLGTATLFVPGCYFDTTATTNVTLNGTTGMVRGAHAIFENQSVALNGSGAGESRDADGDNAPGDPNPGNNYGENVLTPYFGSVVEWVNAAQTISTAGIVGFPTAAFDWNTFTYYGVYVASQDTGGATSTLYMRNNDGSAHYSYSVTGTLIGTPFWDTETSTDTHVVYLATTSGHITKLIDNGSTLAPPSTAPWNSDFTSTNVATITSPIVGDGTNLYFGGTDTSSPPAPAGPIDIFGVQIATGANEKTLQREFATVSSVTTTPGWVKSSGDTYVYLGSTVSGGAAYVYRVDMTANAVSGSYSGATTNINGGIILSGTRAFAVSDGAKMYVLDALNFGIGGFANLTGFPYDTTKGNAIKLAPWVDYSTKYAYFGDDGGWTFCVSDLGVACTGFPLQLSGSIKITSTPMYRAGGGVIAVGANDGYVYFIDRNTGSGPNMFKRFLVSAGTTPSVSSIAYDSAISSYMVASADGKLVFINAADVTDPTSTTH